MGFMGRFWQLCLRLFFILALWTGFAVAPAYAATCGAATGQGVAGPTGWQTYCWLDMTSYNDASARTAAGQNFSIALSDGSTLSFNMHVISTTPKPGSTTVTTALVASISPTWTGAAFGNRAFTGVPNKPVLYTGDGGSITTFEIRNILITPPPGVPAITTYAFVAADGESTAANLTGTTVTASEQVKFITNGGNWALLDDISPSTGTNFPNQSGIGSATFTETGVTGDPVGGYVVGSSNPTTITTTLSPIPANSGKQGALFAVRFASMRLTKVISGARADPADQFKFDINSTSGTNLATGTTTGTGLGPFAAAGVSVVSGIPLTLTESMAAGSVSTLSHYRSSLTCTNDTTGSSTALPSAVLTTSHNFGTLQFGDAVQCAFTNTPFPHLTLQKLLGTGGRQFAADQFIMNIDQGSTNVATMTTTGAAATVTTGITPQYQATVATSYKMAEVGSGVTSLAQYTAVLSCTNANTSSTTVLPTVVGGTITPQMGDVVLCRITNTKKPGNANLQVTKSSQVTSDSISVTNPKAIPGAIIKYSLFVQNTGSLSVDNNTVFLIDALPANISIGTAAAPALVQGTPTSALTFNAATDVRYSNQTTAPADFAACSAAPHNYTPTSAYDPAVKYICINPKGAMAGSTGTPPSFTISFNARVN
jgi:hypothetical protein